MKVVGITGGIGSGKTTVAKMFANKGIPVYTADDEAKKLMNTSKVIKRQLTKLLGEQSYVDGEINRSYISSKIFNNKSLLQKINAIVHPKVATHFQRWLKRQTTPYVIKEAAIIFENNLQDQYDAVITVVTDKATRIQRVLKRQNITVEQIENIIKNQMPDEEKIKLSTYVIYNQDIDETAQQVSDIHHEILKSLN